MAEQTVPAMRAPSPGRDNPLTRSLAGIIGMIPLGVLVLACVGSLPWALGENADGAVRYNAQNLNANLLPPSWAPHSDEERAKAEALGNPLYLFGTDRFGRDVFVRCLAGGGISIGIGLAAAFIAVGIGTIYGSLAGYIGGRVDSAMMRFVDILYGLPYILLVVLLAVAGDAIIDEATLKKTARADWITERAYAALEEQGVEDPNKDDAREYLDAHPDFRVLLDEQLTMGPYLARSEQTNDAGESVEYTKGELFDLWVEERAPTLASLPGYELDLSDERNLERAFGSLRSLQPTPLSEGQRTALEVLVLLVAIGGVSWLTMARVIRGQVLSLKERPFMEAARAMGVPVHKQFLRHLLPNLVGPIVVYATLTVPQAVLQESFLSFLGIGVAPPLPSWGNLAAEGLSELNTVKVRWWLIVTPCVLLGATLLALNFVGEGLREAFDPKRARK